MRSYVRDSIYKLIALIEDNGSYPFDSVGAFFFMKELEVKGGLKTQVDDEDYEWLNQWKWRMDWKSGAGYVVRRTTKGVANKKRSLRLHRVIMGVLDRPEITIDHVDGNPFNNQRSNLRLASCSQNGCNRGPLVGSSSKFKGVYWNKSAAKWKAEVAYSGKRFHLGYFEDEEAAARAYDVRAKELHGEFARLNFPSLP